MFDKSIKTGAILTFHKVQTYDTAKQMEPPVEGYRLHSTVVAQGFGSGESPARWVQPPKVVCTWVPNEQQNNA